MQYAMTATGRTKAELDTQDAWCPSCEAPMIAKCGQVISWHWAHQSAHDCDPWHQESAWHLEWKSHYPEQSREVVIGPHRADVQYDGVVIEFQHSGISVDDIRAREQFYGPKMVWVWDASDACAQGRLAIMEKEGDTGTYHTFRWRSPVKTIGACQRPLFLDTGRALFRVRKIHRGKGWGHLLRRDWLTPEQNGPQLNDDRWPGHPRPHGPMTHDWRVAHETGWEMSSGEGPITTRQSIQYCNGCRAVNGDPPLSDDVDISYRHATGPYKKIMDGLNPMSALPKTLFSDHVRRTEPVKKRNPITGNEWVSRFYSKEDSLARMEIDPMLIDWLVPGWWDLSRELDRWGVSVDAEAAA